MYTRESELQIAAPNGFEGTVSGEVAGIIATLYALSALAQRYRQSEPLAHGFYELRDFALQHASAQVILSATD